MLEQNNTQIEFQIQRIYAKDISFEAPNTPKIFQLDWHPKIKLNLNTTSSQLDDKIHEVVLCITVTVSLVNETAFLCEVQQAGIFIISGVNSTKMAHYLGAYCPTILFPYARECITSQVSRGTFPQLTLAPINFDALFMNHLQQQQANSDGEGLQPSKDA